jgi:hypothetical protein
MLPGKKELEFSMWEIFGKLFYQKKIVPLYVYMKAVGKFFNNTLSVEKEVEF